MELNQQEYNELMELLEDKGRIKLLLQKINDTLEGGIRSTNLKEYRNTYIVNAQDSLDANYPLYVHFSIIPEMTKIVSIQLSFWFLNFRAYATAAKMSGNLTIGWANILFDGNGFVKTSASEGDYAIPETAMLRDIRTHTHDITYGIFEDSTSPTVMIYISKDNGLTYSLPLGSYTADQSLDITRFIDTAGSKMIKFTSNARARLSVQIEIKLDIKAR